MKVFIATPVAGDSVKAAFAKTVANVIAALAAKGIDARFEFVGCSDIVVGRNILTHYFWRDTSCTHLLFVDSDMTFPGQLVLDMLAIDQPVLGTSYPKRQIDLREVVKVARETALPLDDVLAKVLRYTVRIEAGTHQVNKGMVQVAGFGFGCVLIKREALQRMIDAKVAPYHAAGLYKEVGIQEEVYGYFNQVLLPTGMALSEDLSFCHRWRQVPGAELWALVDRPVGHVGQMTFETPYFLRMRQGLG
jgi:hypothetical protein